jgi:hypothetical protein
MSTLLHFIVYVFTQFADCIRTGCKSNWITRMKLTQFLQRVLNMEKKLTACSPYKTDRVTRAACVN